MESKKERKKVVHVLDTPYSAVQWPYTSQENQDAILELLCSFLRPLGEYKRSYVTSSKGKRSKSRKRKEKQEEDPEVKSLPPPPPSLASCVDVGLAKITRVLQEAASKNVSIVSPSSPPATTESGPDPESGTKARATNPSPYSAVFVARSGQLSAFSCHFPQMVAAASASEAGEKAIRLVGFSKPAEDRLSAALGIPRVSSIALRTEAPQSKALVDFVREHVPAVKVSWLEEARGALHIQTKINAVETVVGTKRKRAS